MAAFRGDVRWKGASVTLRLPDGVVRIPLYHLRRAVLAAEREHFEEDCCVRCSALLGERIYNGGAGRRLCATCGPAEAAPLARKREKR